MNELRRMVIAAFVVFFLVVSGLYLLDGDPHTDAVASSAFALAMWAWLWIDRLYEHIDRLEQRERQRVFGPP